MRPPPSVKELPRYPIVGGLALLAIGVTLAWWGERVDITPPRESPLMRQGQLWRLVTPILPHVNPMHLAFNVYWLWVFGTLVEEQFGHARALATVLLFAVGSCAAEYALMHGGVGLSGVGYGLFGLLWVLSRYDPRFEGAVDQNTTGLFIGWFFLCILLTVAGVMRVANVAHGVGAVLGAGLGLAIAHPRRRALYATALSLFVAASAGAALYARQFVNLTSDRGEEWAQLGLEDLLRKNDTRAASRLTEAVRVDDRQAWAWYNLGVARHRLGHEAESQEAFERAAALEPGNPDYQRAAGRVRGGDATGGGGPG